MYNKLEERFLGNYKIIKQTYIHIKKNRIPGSFLKSTGIVEGVIWN